jgi:hypothetical protein
LHKNINWVGRQESFEFSGTFLLLSSCLILKRYVMLSGGSNSIKGDKNQLGEKNRGDSPSACTFCRTNSLTRDKIWKERQETCENLPGSEHTSGKSGTLQKVSSRWHGE